MDFGLQSLMFVDSIPYMPSLSEIEEWRVKHSVTRKQLAEMLHVNYKALCPVLAGTRPLSPQLAARIEELMQQYSGGLRITLPSELVLVLTTWASTAKLSVDELVEKLLFDALKMKK